MSLEIVSLGKLLSIMYATPSARVGMLRRDIRETIKKENGGGNGKGGDFYVPFWADAKQHVSGDADLATEVAKRIDANDRRERLYLLLRDGFLLWWEQKRRERNEPFKIIEHNIKARYPCVGLGVVKVENTLSITVGGDGHRIICPYFCEDPPLSDEGARLGLWLMSQCIKTYSLQDMRLLDVIQGRTYSTLDTPLQGDEEALFLTRYEAALLEWQKLRSEYD